MTDAKTDYPNLDRCPNCGTLGVLVTAEGGVTVLACPRYPEQHPDWSMPTGARSQAVQTAEDLLDLLVRLPLNTIVEVIHQWSAGHEDVPRCKSCGRSWDGGCLVWDLIHDLEREAENA